MQIVYVHALGVSTAVLATVAQRRGLLSEARPKMNLPTSRIQIVIVARSSPSKTSQCALRKFDQLVVRLRLGAASMPFLLRMFETVLEQIA